MELINYIGLKVKIIVSNGYYYIGNVISADERSIDIRDMKNKYVSLGKEYIMSIQEVENGSV